MPSRFIPWLFAAGMTFIVAVNGVLVYFALGTWSGLVVERPYVVQRTYVTPAPILYSAPMPAYGPAQMIGSAIGSYIDSQNY